MPLCPRLTSRASEKVSSAAFRSRSWGVTRAWSGRPGFSIETPNAPEVGENAHRVSQIGLRRLVDVELALDPRELTPGDGGELSLDEQSLTLDAPGVGRLFVAWAFPVDVRPVGRGKL